MPASWLDQQRLAGQAGHVEPGLVIGGKDRDRTRDDPDPERGYTIESSVVGASMVQRGTVPPSRG